jgi:hypothetical protein
VSLRTPTFWHGHLTNGVGVRKLTPTYACFDRGMIGGDFKIPILDGSTTRFIVNGLMQLVTGCGYSLFFSGLAKPKHFRNKFPNHLP